MDLIGATYYNL